MFFKRNHIRVCMVSITTRRFIRGQNYAKPYLLIYPPEHSVYHVASVIVQWGWQANLCNFSKWTKVSLKQFAAQIANKQRNLGLFLSLDLGGLYVIYNFDFVALCCFRFLSRTSFHIFSLHAGMASKRLNSQNQKHTYDDIISGCKIWHYDWHKVCVKKWIPHIIPWFRVPTGKLVEISSHFMQPESLSPCLQDSITRTQRNGTYQTDARFSYEFVYKYVIIFLHGRRCFKSTQL
jgi:hypothetical protein